MNPNRASARFLTKQNSNLTQSQAAASAALPAVLTPPNAALRRESTESSFGFVTVNLGANDATDVRIPGRFVLVYSMIASGAPVLAATPVITLSPDQKGSIPVFQAPARFDGLQSFSTVRVTNNQAFALTVGLFVGQAENLQLPAGPWDQTLNAGPYPTGMKYKAIVMTRPNNVTPYTVGDLVDATIAGGIIIPQVTMRASGVVSPTGKIRLKKVRLEKDGTTVTNAAFRIYFFNTYSVPPVADNAPYAVAFNDHTFETAVDIPSMTAEGGTQGAFGEASNLDIPVTSDVATGNLNAYLVASAAYVPNANERFQLVIWGELY